MQEITCRNWAIKPAKTQFIILVYNCLTEQGFKKSGPVNDLKKITVITLGHVDIRKNPSLWLTVAKKITSVYSNVTFCWLGNGPLLDQFKEETKHESAITFLGLIENPQYFLEQSAIYYQPSIVEPHGIAVIEAMYNKLPCVVSNVGGLPESVKHDYNGIAVEVNNLRENVNAIIELLEDADKRSRYGQNGFKRYHELFSYTAFKEKMDAVYA
jgi:glycosyltransferase involved in cell wall biosynthesis